jgi:hypothetical protein
MIVSSGGLIQFYTCTDLSNKEEEKSVCELEMCGTKKIILYRDRDQKKNFTGTEKNYRDRDQIKRVTGTWTGTGTKKSWSRTYLVRTHTNFWMLVKNFFDFFDQFSIEFSNRIYFWNFVLSHLMSCCPMGKDSAIQ